MERILQLLNDILTAFVSAIPKFILALIVFILGWIIAKIAAVLMARVLKAIKVDELAAKVNEIEIISKSNITLIPSKIFSKILYYILLLIFAVISFEILNIEAVSQLVANILHYIPNVIAAILLLTIGLLFADFIKNIIQTAMQSMGIPSAKLIATFIFYFVFIMVTVTALEQLGIDTDFISTNLSAIFVGGIFAFALGYGFASKDMMANFLASFYSKDKFKIGDTISIEGIKGEIVDMDNASLTLKSIENKKIIVPLSKLTSENVELYDV